MEPNLVLVHMLENALGLAAILIAVGGVYVALFRRAIYSIWDPFLLVLVFSGFGAAVVVYLFAYGLIEVQYLVSYLATQAAFVLGVLWFRPVSPGSFAPDAPAGAPTDGPFAAMLFLVSAFGYVAAQVAAYAVLGIPLLMQSRLEMFADAGAFAVLKRVIEVCGPVAVFLAVHFAFFDETRTVRRTAIAVLLFSVASGFLSGSKSTFLALVASMFFYRHFALRWGRHEWPPNLKRALWVAAIGAGVAAAAVIAIQTAEDPVNPIGLLLYRLMLSGDVYMYAYPNGVIEQMEEGNPILAVFRGFFGNTGLVPWEQLPPQLGHELFRYVNPGSEMLLGPNPRHNVFGLRYFGPWLSPAYSFVLGLSLGFVRNRLYFRVPPTLLGGAIYASLLAAMLAIETDVHITIGVLSNLAVLGPLLLFAAHVLHSYLGGRPQASEAAGTPP
jgi:hypothetical protein